MCGIVGYIDFREKASASLAQRMAEVLAYRGPDDDGVWSHGPVALGHRRLAIIDLSDAGHQPMFNETGDVVLVYNGELYNYRELREVLVRSGHTFQSQTDSEVIIHAYEEWGSACVDRFNGHFAFAVWDQTAEELFLARDRFGVKPLYYHRSGHHFVFGSEIKALLLHPEVSPSVCFEGLSEYFTFQNILSDLTLFEGVRLLPPGSYLKVDLKGSGRVEPVKYWDYKIGREECSLTRAEAEEELFRLFTQAVKRQLMSDVPIGSYLSGGLDSGSIAAVARQHLERLMTFTMGFDLSSASGLELGFDERKNSEVLANLLKTEHYEMILHSGDMEHIVPELIEHFEDLRVGQCYQNYYVARLTGKFVKVTLSGIGGDELFGGYPWRYCHAIGASSEDEYYRKYYGFWQRLIRDSDKASFFRPETYSRLSGYSTFDQFKSIIQQSGVVPDSYESSINASLYFELRTFLHGLLVMEDRVSMAHSLETRVPFLDNDLVDFALSLPVSYKLKDLRELTNTVDDTDIDRQRKFEVQTNYGKIIFRDAMTRLIPGDVTDRIKQGFSAPDASWFRGESIDYVNKVLKNPQTRVYEYLNPDYVERVLEEHTAGVANHRLLIWSLLSFEWWLKIFL